MTRILLMLAAASSLLGACAAPAGPQQAGNSQYCESFAHSGGYPYLRGGNVYGPSSDFEQLPGAPPLIHGPFDNEIQRHLDEEDYLRNWCNANM